MDNVIIKGLEVFANHGVLEEEKRLGQKFIINIVAHLDLSKAYKTDNLSETVNYAEICKFVEKYMKENTFDLIETVAGRIAEELLIIYDLINEIDVEVVKPWAPIGVNLDSVSVKINRKWKEVFLSLGSNMGDRHNNINEAIRYLQEDRLCKVIKISDMIETEPVGGVEQDDFINCAVAINTLRNPYELLELIGEIEHKLKRERIVHWGPRTIDLDIILYEDEVIITNELTIPHCQMHLRKFVLEPLTQIAPTAFHPVLKKYIYEL